MFPTSGARLSTSDSSGRSPPRPHLVEPYFRSSPELTGHQSVRLQFFCMPHPRSSLSVAFRCSLVGLLSPSAIYDCSVPVSFTRISNFAIAGEILSTLNLCDYDHRRAEARGEEAFAKASSIHS